MTVKKAILILGLALSVSACSVLDLPTRNTPFEAVSEDYSDTEATPEVAVSTVDQVPPVRVNKVSVVVPTSLAVSEANSYLPKGDIVWREDPIGDRHKQVQKIVETAMKQGVADLKGRVPVDIEVEVLKFHALTEKARYTTGGVHGLSFRLSIKDAKTGELVVPVRDVRADLKAFGGTQALVAQAAGQTQKVRITNHLAEVIYLELTDPKGYKNATLGFIQALNYL